MNDQSINDVFREISSLEEDMGDNIEDAKRKAEKMLQEAQIASNKELEETKASVQREIDTMINEAKEEAKEEVEKIASKTSSILTTIAKIDPQKIKKAKELIIDQVTGAVNA